MLVTQFHDQFGLGTVIVLWLQCVLAIAAAILCGDQKTTKIRHNKQIAVMVKKNKKEITNRNYLLTISCYTLSLLADHPRITLFLYVSNFRIHFVTVIAWMKHFLYLSNSSPYLKMNTHITKPTLDYNHGNIFCVWFIYSLKFFG